MVSQKVKIKNPTGLHLRPAGILCKEAMQYKSLVTFHYRGNTANAKSVLSVLGACIKFGDEIEFVCEGDDEDEEQFARNMQQVMWNLSIQMLLQGMELFLWTLQISMR